MKRPCLYGHGTYAGRHCPECERQRTRSRDLSHYNDREYREQRAELVRIEPWCHNPKCPYDDVGSTANPLTADHVIPVAQGGRAGPLTVLCKRCNSGKRDRTN